MLGEKGKVGKSIPKAFPMGVIQAVIRAGAFNSYKYSIIVSHAAAKKILGHGLPFAFSGHLTRSIKVFSGPIGWTVSALWTIFDLAQPAYRVTVPCVLHIAMLRRKHAHEAAKKNTGRKA